MKVAVGRGHVRKMMSTAAPNPEGERRGELSVLEWGWGKRKEGIPQDPLETGNPSFPFPRRGDLSISGTG
jgi:hypothetical protein